MHVKQTSHGARCKWKRIANISELKSSTLLCRSILSNRIKFLPLIFRTVWWRCWLGSAGPNRRSRLSAPSSRPYLPQISYQQMSRVSILVRCDYQRKFFRLSVSLEKCRSSELHFGQHIDWWYMPPVEKKSKRANCNGFIPVASQFSFRCSTSSVPTCSQG